MKIILIDSALIHEVFYIIKICVLIQIPSLIVSSVGDDIFTFKPSLSCLCV